MPKPVKESSGLAVNVVATVCDLSSFEARDMSARIEAGEHDLIPELHRRFGVERREFANIVPLVGLTALAKAVSGNLSALADIEVNKSALGTGAATPLTGDVGLQTEVYRKNIASQAYASNVAYNVAFYAATDVAGTFEEHALFMNGGSGSGTGTLLSRVLLGGITKTATNSLTIEHQSTFVFNT